jgi:hypothetical protein
VGVAQDTERIPQRGSASALHRAEHCENHMGPGRRLQDHPHLLDRAYRATRRVLVRLGPWRPDSSAVRTAGWLCGAEAVGKRWIFDCRMCGQCVLHETGMTCPMTCPKNLRNGPCGGVRIDGSCEVAPQMRCIWVEAVERAQTTKRLAEGLTRLKAPLDGRLEGSSSWINSLTGADAPSAPGWRDGAGDPGPGD